MNSDNIQSLLGNKIIKIMKKKNEQILEQMKFAENEQDKMKIWDKHMAQKILDDRPKNTLQIKLSEYLKGVCKDWQDNLKESEMKEMLKKQEQEAERDKRERELSRGTRTIVQIVKTTQYENQLKKLKSESQGAHIKQVDVTNVIGDNII